MSNYLYGCNGTSLSLAFMNDIDFVVDEEWNNYSIKNKILYEIYWRLILLKPFSRVCFPIDKLSMTKPTQDTLILGNIYKREKIVPILNKFGYFEEVNLFEAFDLSSKFCSLRRLGVTNEEILHKDFEDDFPKLSILAKYIPDDTQSIMDIGCGRRRLKELIKNETTYVGIDYKHQAPDIINKDLNKENLPNIKVDCVFCCGILEFVDDVHHLVDQIILNSPKYILLTYSPREYSSYSTKRSRVYHNCLYSVEIVSWFCNAGYHLNIFKRFESRQAFYVFSKL